MIGDERGIRRGYEAFNRRDVDDILPRLDASIEFRMPLDPMGVDPVYRGLEGVRAFSERLWGAFEEFRADVADVTSLGEVVVVSGRMTARATGAHEATSFKFAHFWRVRDDRAVAVAFHDAVNPFALLEQPAAAAPPRREEDPEPR
jgi:ketosteroid isomerase-like protein